MEKAGTIGIKIGWPEVGQIPLALLRDPKAPHAPVRLFGVLYTFARHQDLKNDPLMVVSYKTLHNYMGISVTQISKWINWLHNEGWITSRPTGRRLIITLHNRKHRRFKMEKKA